MAEHRARVPLVSRSATRRRLAALERALAEIRSEWGDLVDQLMSAGDGYGHEPTVPLVSAIPHGYPEDTLANDVELTPWEVLLLLSSLADRVEAVLHGEEITDG